jgi:hypothetical protein
VPVTRPRGARVTDSWTACCRAVSTTDITEIKRSQYQRRSTRRSWSANAEPQCGVIASHDLQEPLG